MLLRPRPFVLSPDSKSRIKKRGSIYSPNLMSARDYFYFQALIIVNERVDEDILISTREQQSFYSYTQRYESTRDRLSHGLPHHVLQGMQESLATETTFCKTGWGNFTEISLR